GVPNIFLPDSEIQYHLNWRNVKRIDLTLYAVDLNRDPNLSGPNAASTWLQSIDLSGREKIKSWSHDPHPASGHPLPSDGRGAGGEGDYQPGNEILRLDLKLKPGAYVLEASAASRTSRELILVTDAALVLKTSG